MKKASKKEYSKDELGRYIGALSERYEDDIKAIRAGVKSLIEASDRQEKTLESHSNQIGKLTINTTIVKTNLKELSSDINKLKTEMNEVKSNVKEVRADMIEVKSDVKNIKFDVKMDLNRKIDKTQFVDLEGRVRVLEKNK